MLDTKHMITMSLSIFSWSAHSLCPQLTYIWICDLYMNTGICGGLRVWVLSCSLCGSATGKSDWSTSYGNRRRWLGPQCGAKNSPTAVCEERVNKTGTAPDHRIDGALKHICVTRTLDHKQIERTVCNTIYFSASSNYCVFSFWFCSLWKQNAHLKRDIFEWYCCNH